MHTILLSNAEDSSKSSRRRWYLSNLSFANSTEADFAARKPLGEVTSEGYCQFASGTLPPEMFVKLSPPDLRAYRRYWEYVQNKLKVKCDIEAVEPKIDSRTGEAYGLRCHFLPLTESNASSVPKLPYELVKSSLSQDLWGFGLVLFHLCAGHPLFPVNNRTGHLLSFHDICNWTLKDAKDHIYKHIKDNYMAQDLLLRLLSPAELRANETIQSILSHPFFSDKAGSSSVGVEKWKMEAIAHERCFESKLVEISENALLEKRTLKIN